MKNAKREYNEQKERCGCGAQDCDPVFRLFTDHGMMAEKVLKDLSVTILEHADVTTRDLESEDEGRIMSGFAAISKTLESLAKKAGILEAEAYESATNEPDVASYISDLRFWQENPAAANGFDAADKDFVQFATRYGMHLNESGKLALHDLRATAEREIKAREAAEEAEAEAGARLAHDVAEFIPQYGMRKLAGNIADGLEFAGSSVADNGNWECLLDACKAILGSK